jgi:hypothetical protein
MLPAHGAREDAPHGFRFLVRFEDAPHGFRFLVRFEDAPHGFRFLVRFEDAKPHQKRNTLPTIYGFG